MSKSTTTDGKAVSVKLNMGLLPLDEGDTYAFYTPLSCIVQIKQRLSTGRTKIIFNDEAQTERSVETSQLMRLRLVIGTNPFTKKKEKFQIPVHIDNNVQTLHRITRSVVEVVITKSCPAKGINLSDLLSS